MPRSDEGAHFIEFFSGIQGEGVLIGERMIFSRFTACNLSCNYCDTPMGRPLDTVVRIEQSAGKRDFREQTNPLRVEDVLEAVSGLHRAPFLHRWVSLTGGEPLLYTDFIERLLNPLHELGLQIYLETNGVFADRLQRLVEHIDLVSMDIKEPGDGARIEDAIRFLAVANRTTSVYVKMVVRPDPDVDHFVQATREIARVAPDTLLILMPVTTYGPITESPPPEQVLALHTRLLQEHHLVRVIPQTHKLIGQL